MIKATEVIKIHKDEICKYLDEPPTEKDNLDSQIFKWHFT